jgi:hypothetical protein
MTQEGVVVRKKLKLWHNGLLLGKKLEGELVASGRYDVEHLLTGSDNPTALLEGEVRTGCAEIRAYFLGNPAL